MALQASLFDMIPLTEHFNLEEFQLGDPIPYECVPAFRALCREILEPVRTKFNCPLRITSGYRSPAENAAAHGQPNSEHMATAIMAAADFYPVPSSPGLVTCDDIFDFMRADPTLPYHQLILERGQSGSVIHVSFNAAKVGVRSVLVGATHNSAPYVAATHVEYSA